MRDGKLRLPLAARAVRLLDGPLGKLWITVGAVLGLFIAGYTGVLLAVSNQPVWSDTWALGGLFLASGLVRLGRAAPAARPLPARTRGPARGFLELGERLFARARAGAAGGLRAHADPGTARWTRRSASRGSCSGSSRSRGCCPGSAGSSPPGSPSPLTGSRSPSRGGVGERARLVLIGVLALRAAVIFSAQL